MTTTTTPITPDAVRTVLYRHGFTETEVKGVLAELGEAESPAVTSRPVAAALRRAKAAEAKLAALQPEWDKYWPALWIMVDQFGGSVFLTREQLAEVPPLATLGSASEPRGLRINAQEEP